ncbi:hypothetical protein OFB79_25400, partial [Escherichia coli]|nr:hypothetical protein [Escherichia coli]
VLYRVRREEEERGSRVSVVETSRMAIGVPGAGAGAAKVKPKERTRRERALVRMGWKSILTLLQSAWLLERDLVLVDKSCSFGFIFRSRLN